MYHRLFLEERYLLLWKQLTIHTYICAWVQHHKVDQFPIEPHTNSLVEASPVETHHICGKPETKTYSHSS